MGDVELQVPHGNGNRLSVVEVEGRKRSNSAASHSSQLSKLSTGEYFGDEKELEASKKEAEKAYAKDKVPGHVSRRRCRDIFWLFLFIQYWVIMFVIAYFAFTQGDPSRLLLGMDSEGNLCSRNNSNRDLTDKPYLYYFDLLNPYDGYTKCVSSCPNVTIDFSGNATSGPLSSAICAYDFVPSDADELEDAIENGTCTGLIYPGFVVVGRCFPNLTGEIGSLPLYENLDASFTSALADNGFSFEFQRDLYAAWPILLMYSSLSLIIILMVFFTIALLVLSTIASMIYLWYRYYQLHTGGSIAIFDYITTNFLSTLSSYALTENTYLGCAITVTILSVIFYLALIFLRKRILLAVTVIKIASRALKHVPMLVFFPVVKFMMLLGLTAWFVLVLVYLATSGSITQVDLGGYYTFESNYILEYLQLYYLFGFLWAWNVTIAIGDCTIAGVIGTYYWTMDKKKLPRFMIFPAFYRTFRYHLGSLAFGSFIIALVQFIRYLLYKAEKKLKGSQNAFLKHLLKILQCIFLCFERFLKFLNKNAYIEIAVYGYGFCKAAKWAFQLITRNIIRVFVISKLGDFLLFIGKVVITILTAIAGNLLIEYYSTEPTYWLTPMLVIIVFAYGTAYCFMAVLDMTVSTIFLCFCEDIERNDGSAERPFFMDPKLRKYVDKEAKAETDLAKK